MCVYVCVCVRVCVCMCVCFPKSGDRERERDAFTNVILHVNILCIYMYLHVSNPSHDIFIRHPLVSYHMFNSTGNFKKVLSATTLCQAVPFDFECTFVKQYFGHDKSHGLDYYEFSQLLQVYCTCI